MSRSANPTKSLPQLLTFREATRYGYGSYSTLCKLIEKGELPSVSIGGRVKIRLDDLVDLATPRPPLRDETAEAIPLPTQAQQETTEQAIQRILASAPPLSPQQRERLALLVGGAS